MRTTRRQFFQRVSAAAAASSLQAAQTAPQESAPPVNGDPLKVDPAAFAEPAKEFRQHAWLTLNLSRATEQNMEAQVRRWAEQDLTGGFYLGIGGGSTAGLSEEYLAGSGRRKTEEGIAYLSEEYFELYAKTIEAGLKYNHPPRVFYDEWGYPSGMAGGHLYSKHPEYAAKSLEKAERDVEGPARVDMEIPDGIPLGAVRMNLETRELVDISTAIEGGRRLSCQVPAGRWKVMGFYLDPKASLGQGNKSGYVDYLDPEAVRAYISLSYQAHYDHLKQYFGSVLKITHYDEPAMHVANGRMWTPRFNEYFQKEFGYNPMKYYPALWYDIGPETTAARNALWGFRAKLFAESYIKQLDDWCREHGILFSGHLDQEEITNPVPVNGDLMLAFKHQGAPGIDDIWWWGRTNRAYKLVSSAAYNWDKPIVMAETYAAYREMSPAIVYKVAMDQATMGANFQVGALPRAKTPESDRFIGRLCYLLQHGRHVADVAVLYPIASLQAAYRFGDWGDAAKRRGPDVAYAREGGIVPPEIDYIELGELLFRGLRLDFTFLHPETLEQRCRIEGSKLVLNNTVNREVYSVLIVPGGKVLRAESARKIKAFFDAGGTVIATKALAEESAELGRNREVREIIDEVFGIPSSGPIRAEFQRRIDEFMVHFVNRNPAGGKAYFLPDYTPAMLQAVLKEALPVWDVAVAEPMWPVVIGREYSGSLTYIHKIKDGRNIYLFANSSDRQVDTQAALRGRMRLALWNPMDGSIRPAESAHVAAPDGTEITQVKLQLPAVSAVFFVEET